MKSVIVLSLLPILLLAFSYTGHAYKLEYDENGHNLHWSAANFPVPYKITSSPPIHHDDFTRAVHQAFGAWQGVQDSHITFQLAGTTDAKEPALDGENSIIMGEKVSGGDVVGQAYIFYSTDDGSILDVDIVLNSSFKWATDGSPGNMDVQDALTHEIGHFCGLNDLYRDEDKEKTMYGYIDLGETKKRTLDPDDAAGLVAIYPKSSGSEDSGGGGGGGCGTISPISSPPHYGDINFLWMFLLIAILAGRRLFLSNSNN